MGAGWGSDAVEEVFLFLLVLPRRYTGEGDSYPLGQGSIEACGEATVGYRIDRVTRVRVGSKAMRFAKSTRVNGEDMLQTQNAHRKTKAG